MYNTRLSILSFIFQEQQKVCFINVFICCWCLLTLIMRLQSAGKSGLKACSEAAALSRSPRTDYYDYPASPTFNNDVAHFDTDALLFTKPLLELRTVNCRSLFAEGFFFALHKCRRSNSGLLWEKRAGKKRGCTLWVAFVFVTIIISHCPSTSVFSFLPSYLPLHLSPAPSFHTLRF